MDAGNDAQQSDTVHALFNISVGFDIRDDIKIFDFGLSKEITHLTKDENDTYKLTGMSK